MVLSRWNDPRKREGMKVSRSVITSGYGKCGVLANNAVNPI